MNLRFRLILLLALLLAGAARAQSTLPGQRFQLVGSAGATRSLCVGTSYRIEDLTPNVPPTFVVAYDFDLRNGLAGAQVVTTFAPIQPGRFRFTQIISNPALGTNDTVSQAYRVYPTAAPWVRIDTCLRSVQVTLLDTSYNRFTVQFGASAPITATRGQTVSSAQAPGVNATTLTVRVTGSNSGVCPSAPLVVDVPLRALPPVPRIRLLDVTAPTAGRRDRRR